MDKSLKRIIAFALDILLVTCVVTMLTKWTGIDPYLEKYNDTYEEYMELVKEANNNSSNIEYYEEQLFTLNHEIYEYRAVSSTISVVALILYFGLFQGLCDGQTIGKKLMKLKVVSNKDKKLNPLNYLLRVIILNNIIFTVICMVCVYFTNDLNFYYITYIISLMQTTIYILNVLFIVFRKDGRGLHDIIAGTKVIELVDPNTDALESKKEEIVAEVKEVEVIPKKETPKKTTTKNTKKTTTSKKKTTSTKKTTNSKKKSE